MLIQSFTTTHSSTPHLQNVSRSSRRGSGNIVPQFDGYAEFLVHSLDCFVLAFDDKEYAEKIKPDEDHLFGRDRAGGMTTASCGEVYPENREVKSVSQPRGE